MPKETQLHITHHIVYSTKGGCGKTALAVSMALSNLCYTKKDGKIYECINNDKTKIINYLIDLDLLGTSLLDCLGCADNKKREQIVTLQDLIFDVKDVDDIILLGDPNQNFGLHSNNAVDTYIIPAAFAEQEKEKFHVKRKHTPLLRYDEFRYQIKALIKAIEINVRSSYVINNGTKGLDDICLNIIYDLPPNSDGYTEAFFEELFCVEEGKILYLPYSNDAMQNCNLGWLNNFFSGNNSLKVCPIIFVNNDMHGTKQVTDRAELNSIRQQLVNKSMATGIMCLSYDGDILAFSNHSSVKKTLKCVPNIVWETK